MRIAIIGAGIVGASTAKALLEQSHEVTLYDRVGFMQERSAGSSRIFRLAHRCPELVRLACDASLTFEDWEREFGARLLDRRGTVITGPLASLTSWQEAMRGAHAAYELETDSAALSLPMRPVGLPSLIDPAGGVILADRVRRFLYERLHEHLQLAEVTGVEDHGTHARVLLHRASFGGVRFGEATVDYDAVLIAAGNGTPALAKSLAIEVPNPQAHHFRFTFQLQDPAATFPSWLARFEDISTYQHLSARGEWAVGAHLSPELVGLEVPYATAKRNARHAVLDFVTTHLPGIVPKVIDTLYQSTNPEIGDGYEVRRNGAVLTIHGENLFKLGPTLGRELADGLANSTLPYSVMLPSPADGVTMPCLSNRGAHRD